MADCTYLDGVRFRTYQDRTVAAGLERVRLVGSWCSVSLRALARDPRAAPQRGPVAEHVDDRRDPRRGRFGYRQAEATERDDTGRALRGTIGQGSYAVDLATGGVTDFDAFTYDTAARTGAFTFRYGAFGITERGTLKNMRVAADGGVSYAFWGPLDADDGESEVVDAAGKRLFTRTRLREGEAIKLGYDLGVTASPWHWCARRIGAPPGGLSRMASRSPTSSAKAASTARWSSS